MIINTSTTRSRPGRLFRVLAAYVLLSLFCSILFPSSALAGEGSQQTGPDRQSTDNLDPALLAIMRQQEALQPAVDLLSAEMGRSGSPGFTSFAFEDAGLTLYWKGPLTPGVAIALQQARRFGKIVVRSAKHSKAELERAAKGMSGNLPDSEIAGILLKHDGSGIEVERMTPTVAAVARTKAPHKALSTLESVLSRSELHGVPVTVKENGATVELLACFGGTCTRRDDQSAWNGGTFLEVPRPTEIQHCTSGFGVWKGGFSYLVTASHCANTSEYFRDYANEYIGGVYDDSWRFDMMLINGRGWGKIFDGDEFTSYSKAVKSAGDVVVNELLCQSGSKSGTVCGLQTIGYYGNIYGCDSDGDCYYMEGMIQAFQVNGYVAGQAGDSGAPVFSLDGTGVRAKGIVTGRPEADHRYLFYQDWPTISTHFGLSGVVTR